MVNDLLKNRIYIVTVLVCHNVIICKVVITKDAYSQITSEGAWGIIGHYRAYT